MHLCCVAWFNSMHVRNKVVVKLQSSNRFLCGCKVANSMSDKLTFGEAYKLRDEILINGYARHTILNNNLIVIPVVVVTICISYFHEIKEGFKHYNYENYKSSKNETIATKISNNPSVIYGGLWIPSWVKSIHKWTFKIHKINRYSHGVSIGIDEISQIRKDEGRFNDKYGDSKLYGIRSDGLKVQWSASRNSFHYPLRFTAGSTIKMELDLISDFKTLSLTINNHTKETVFVNVAANKYISYCIAVCCMSKGDRIELVSYTYAN